MTLPFWAGPAIKVAIVVALLVGVKWFEGRAEARGDKAGAARVQALWDGEKQEARAIKEQTELEFKRNQEKVMYATAQRNKDLELAADSARNESERLRNTLARYTGSGAGGVSLPSCLADRTALASVFDECQRRYTEMARKAGGHASDALNLWQSWPRVAPRVKSDRAGEGALP